MSRVFLSLDHRGWRLVRSEACLDGACKPVPEARREYWARQWLQGFKCDSSRMAVLRQMLSKDSQGMAIDRATNDDLVDRSVHLLTLGVWHIHSLDRAKLHAQPTKQEEPEAPKENWKRATSVVGPQVVARKSWPIPTSYGDCRVIRAADLALGEEYLQHTPATPLQIAELSRDLRGSWAQIHEAVQATPKAENTAPMAVAIEDAFRNGTLVLLREVRRQGGGGSDNAPAETAPAKKAVVSKEKTDEKTWFRVQLVDEEGQPMKDEDYVVVDSTGTRRTGKLDGKGEMYIPPMLPEGECTVNFPNIHLNPRKRKK
jgi:hypothetical protein